MTDEKLRKIIRTLNPDLLDHLDEDSGEIDHPLRFSVRSPARLETDRTIKPMVSPVSKCV
jgi:hypothetical protein